MALDTLAQKFYTASSSARDSLYSEAQGLIATAGSAAKHYVRVMEKVVNGSTGYIEKETKRCALITTCRWHLRQCQLFFFSFFHYRLEGILSKRNLSPAKLDELKIKFNILKSFVEPASKETISREEAELWMYFSWYWGFKQIICMFRNQLIISWQWFQCG